MTDQEINEAVARGLGWTYDAKFQDWATADDRLAVLPDYCHSIDAAWEVVEFVRVNGLATGYAFQLDCDESGQCAAGWYNNAGNLAWERAATAPMAICLAYLQLSETGVESQV